MRFARFVLVLSALPYFIVGIWFVVAPAQAGELVGIATPTSTSDNSVRALFGGLQVGCGGTLATSALRDRWVSMGLLAAVWVYGGMVFGRLASCLVVGLPSRYVLALLLGEALAALLALAARVRLSRAPSAAA